ncbi:adenosine receptor A2a-like [Actinia tenebrosa]|uniref:Adenosine receptor A2a-like n=1 Tax=Actinia tenebrosa TaxID=6105 RepID=A0A6P8IZY2_ACTTE|nr:adenosine receptor A2a-like [Actinia tenebrosa]
MAVFFDSEKGIWNTSVLEFSLMLEDALRHDLQSYITLITGVVLAVLGPLTTIANAIVIAAIWKDPFKQLRRSPSNIIIASMATCDVLVGTICSVLLAFWFISLSLDAQLPNYYTLVTVALTSSLIGISIMHVLALTIDRIVAVANPLLYKSRVTRKRVLTAVFLIWISILAVELLQIPNHKTSTIMTMVIMVVFGVVEITLSILWVYIIVTVRKETKKIRTNVGLGGDTRTFLERERKTTKAILTVLVLFLICFPPFQITFMIGLLCFSCKGHLNVLLTLLCFSTIVANSNSLVNPFLYAFRLPKFAKPIALILKLLCPCT